MVSQLTHHKLLGLRSKIRLLFAVFGVSIMIGLLSASILVTFGLDYAFRGPWFFRLAINLALIAVMAYCLYRFLIYPLRVRMGLDDMALYVERGYPGLKDRLISSLQLARRYDPSDTFNSSAMVRALVEETDQVTRAMNFGAVARFRQPIIIFGSLALVGIALLIAGYALWHDAPKIWWQRIIMLSEEDPYPRDWEFSISDNDREDFKFVPTGDDVIIKVHVKHTGNSDAIYSGAPPRIEYTFTAGEDRQTKIKELSPIEGGAGDYYALIKAVTESFEFTLIGPEGFAERTFTPMNGFATVVPRPKIESIQHQVILPPYTMTEGPVITINRGEITVPRGSRVRVIVRCSRDIRKGQIVFTKNKIRQSVVELVRPEDESSADDLKVWVAAFTASDSLAYYVVVYDKEYFDTRQGKDDKFTNAEPLSYDVTVLADAAPSIEIASPKDLNTKKVDDGAMRLKVSAKDDLFVKLMVLYLKYRRAGEDFSPEQQLELYDMDKQRWLKKVQEITAPTAFENFLEKQVDIEYILKLKKIDSRMAKADMIRFYVRVFDGFDLRDMPEGVSALTGFGTAVLNAEREIHNDTYATIMRRWTSQMILVGYADTGQTQPLYEYVVPDAAREIIKAYLPLSLAEDKISIDPGVLESMKLSELESAKLKIVALGALLKSEDNKIALAAEELSRALQNYVFKLLLGDFKAQADASTEDFVMHAELTAKIALLNWALAAYNKAPEEKVKELEDDFSQKVAVYKDRVSKLIIGEAISKLRNEVDNAFIKEVAVYYEKAMASEFSSLNGKFRDLADAVRKRREEIRTALWAGPDVPDMTDYLKAVTDFAGWSDYRDRRDYDVLQLVLTSAAPEGSELFNLYAKLCAKGEAEIAVRLSQVNRLHLAEKDLAAERLSDPWRDMVVLSSLDLLPFSEKLTDAVKLTSSEMKDREKKITDLDQEIRKLTENIDKYKQENTDIGSEPPADVAPPADAAPPAVPASPLILQPGAGDAGPAAGGETGGEAVEPAAGEDKYAITSHEQYWQRVKERDALVAQQNYLAVLPKRQKALDSVKDELGKLQKWIGPNFVKSAEMQIDIVDLADKLREVADDARKLVGDLRSVGFEQDRDSRKPLDRYNKLAAIDVFNGTGEDIFNKLIAIYERSEQEALKNRYKKDANAVVDKEAIKLEVAARMKKELDDAWQGQKRIRERMPEMTLRAEAVLEECEDNNDLYPRLQEVLKGTSEKVGAINVLKQIETVFSPQLEYDVNGLRDLTEVKDVKFRLEEYVFPRQIRMLDKLYYVINEIEPLVDIDIIKILADIMQRQHDMTDQLGGPEATPETPTTTPDTPVLVEDTEALKVARTRAEKLGVPQSVLKMLDRDYYGRPEKEVENLNKICDAVDVALARKVSPGVVKTLLELAVEDDWTPEKIVDQLNGLNAPSDNP